MRAFRTPCRARLAGLRHRSPPAPPSRTPASADFAAALGAGVGAARRLSGRRRGRRAQRPRARGSSAPGIGAARRRRGRRLHGPAGNRASPPDRRHRGRHHPPGRRAHPAHAGGDDLRRSAAPTSSRSSGRPSTRSRGRSAANRPTYVDVLGHTDSTGSDAVNQTLSATARAGGRQLSASRGVAAARIAIRGYRRERRRSQARTTREMDRAANRRVEIKVVAAAGRATSAADA